MNRFPVILAALALVFGLALPAAAAPQGDAQVYVIHGIPGQDLGLDPALPVDISVNGGCALTNVKFGDVAGPLPFSPGRYNIAISPADPVNPCSQPPLISVDVDFFADENATVIAHLDNTGAGTATKFVNDASPTAFIKTRLILHHTANAPNVDIGLRREFLNRKQLFRDVPYGAQATTTGVAGYWQFAVAATGTPVPVLGPDFLILDNGVAYTLYVVGSVANGTLTYIVNPIPVGTL